MNKMNTKRKNQGFSLVELLIVMAVIAAMAIIAFLAYPRVMAGRNANYESQVLATAAASAKALFASGNYSGLNNTVAGRAKFFPDVMHSGANGETIVNQFGGDVTVSGSTNAGVAVTTGARHFAITYEDVPTAVCSRLAPALAQNFGAVSVGSSVVKNEYTNATLDEAAVATGCQGTDGLATIIAVSN